MEAYCGYSNQGQAFNGLENVKPLLGLMGIQG